MALLNFRPFNDMIPEIQTTGQFRGKTAYIFNVVGQRAGFTSTTLHNDVKEYDNAVARLATTSNSTLDVISSSASDANPAGTGVRTVKVTYIDNSNNLVESSAIALNGTTLVTSVLTGVNQVLWMESSTVGSTGEAQGNIRLRINGGVVEVEQITAGTNKSRSAVFMVPTGYTGYLINWGASAIGDDQAVVLEAQVNSFDGTLSSVYHIQSTKYTAANTSIPAVPDIYAKIPALARVRVSTISAAAGIAIRVNANILLAIIQD